jgi:hypothetical protein
MSWSLHSRPTTIHLELLTTTWNRQCDDTYVFQHHRRPGCISLFSRENDGKRPRSLDKDGDTNTFVDLVKLRSLLEDSVVASLERAGEVLGR